MDDSPVIVWFRRDLRLGDNPALAAAVEAGSAVVPVFVWAPDEEAPWAPGAASRWWLHRSLEALDRSLREVGSRLLVRRGPTRDALLDLVDSTGARQVFCNRRYEPAVLEAEAEVERTLREREVKLERSGGSLLVDPLTIRTQSGRPYRVFDPFWQACAAHITGLRPRSAPAHVRAPDDWPTSLAIGDLGLEARTEWAADIDEVWRPGEAGAAAGLDRLAAEVVGEYHRRCDRVDLEATSRLSPHLHFGEISPRQVWVALDRLRESTDEAAAREGIDAYRRQLGWREFAHHLLLHFPQSTDGPLDSGFASFPWRDDADELERWQGGLTGYPIVDAAMRELWTTGWMHNRARMIVGSFLAKDLLLSWKEGARWFWDTLVDADLAGNTLGWQWVAGCGADAAPYHDVSNPVKQGERFDPDGEYVRRWVPALASLPSAWIHRPWEAPASVLDHAGLRLESDYPRPVVEHAVARRRALAALEKLRSRSGAE